MSSNTNKCRLCAAGERHLVCMPRASGFLFTMEEAMHLAAKVRDWTARPARNGKWMVWSKKADHYVEF